MQTNLATFNHIILKTIIHCHKAEFMKGKGMIKKDNHIKLNKHILQAMLFVYIYTKYTFSKYTYLFSKCWIMNEVQN